MSQSNTNSEFRREIERLEQNLRVFHSQILNDKDLLVHLVTKQLQRFFWRFVATQTDRVAAWNYVAQSLPESLIDRESLWRVFHQQDAVLPVDLESRQEQVLTFLRSHVHDLVSPPPIHLPNLPAVNVPLAPLPLRGKSNSQQQSQAQPMAHEKNKDIAQDRDPVDGIDTLAGDVVEPTAPILAATLQEKTSDKDSESPSVPCLVNKKGRESTSTFDDTSVLNESLSRRQVTNNSPTSIVDPRGVDTTANGDPDSSSPEAASQKSIPSRTRRRRSGAKPVGRGSPLVYIPPSDTCIVSDLKRLDDYLKDQKNIDKLPEAGKRLIQRDRYEIFLKAGDKPTDAADYCLGILGIRKEKIIEYCVKQAKKDPRTKNLKVFDNFSFILTTKKAKAQYPHLDLQLPNFQFGLLVSDGVPATHVYKIAHEVKNPEDLRRVWGPGVPDSLISAFQKTPEALRLLRDYGNILCKNLEVYESDGNLPRGTVTSLPGGQVHAGPALNDPRVILFFSGGESIDTSYDPDDQFFSSILLVEIIQDVWNACSDVDRKFLLERLADVVKTKGNENMVDVIAESGYVLEDFCVQLNKPYSRKAMLIQNVIKTNASMEKYRSTLKEAAGFAELEALQTKGFGLVSADGLVTEWDDGAAYHVQVYTNGRDVLLFYPGDSSFEGEGQSYQLTFKSSNGELFDGKNGTLLDPDGNKVVCYVQKTTKVQEQRATQSCESSVQPDDSAQGFEQGRPTKKARQS